MNVYSMLGLDDGTSLLHRRRRLSSALQYSKSILLGSFVTMAWISLIDNEEGHTTFSRAANLVHWLSEWHKPLVLVYLCSNKKCPGPTCRLCNWIYYLQMGCIHRISIGIERAIIRYCICMPSLVHSYLDIIYCTFDNFLHQVKPKMKILNQILVL